MQQEKYFKILSIDGGGTKGAYSLSVLKQLEDKYCKEDETLSNYFDMFCGTSVGGSMALGLSCGCRVQKLIDMFYDNVEDIFPGNNSVWLVDKISEAYGGLKQFLGCKYGDDQLKKSVEAHFKEKQLKDVKSAVCVPTYNITTGSNFVFKYPCEHLKNIDLKDVVLSTSAAPTYFPLHEIKSRELKGCFLDGGVWANNPTLVGITESLDNYVGKDKKYEKYAVLSIGNINLNTSSTPWSLSHFFNIFNLSYLITILFNGDSQSIHNYVKSISEHLECPYIRMEETNVHYASGDYGLDNSNKKYLEHLNNLANNYVDDILKTDGSIKTDIFFENHKTLVIY